MIICFFIGSMQSGGAEKVISLLANHYAEKGWDVSIILLLNGNVNRKKYELNDRIKIIDYSGKHTSYLKNSFHWLRSIRKYINEERPDCIISFIGRINALVLTATLGKRIPIIVSERSDPLNDGRGWIMFNYCRIVYFLADIVVFQTRYVRNLFGTIPDRKIVIIPNPVEVEPNIGKAIRNRKLIVTAGRLVNAKNHEMLIKAMEIVHDVCDDAICKIYGTGELKEYLEEVIKEYNLSNVVSLEGNTDSIGTCLKEASVFVLTSKYEGMSNSLLEAMMMGDACISTRYGGIDELINNGENGIIIEQDNKMELAERIIELIQNDDKRERISQNAQKTARQYEIDIILRRWDELIMEISEAKI